MPFIPNSVDASFQAQAEPDSVDFQILIDGLSGKGVLSGCEVTPQGSPDMTVHVADGEIRNADGTTATVTADDVTITTAHATLPRTDLVVSDPAGALSVIDGTASAQAEMPDPGTSIVLASVYVPATDTAIGATQILDKRAVLAAYGTGGGGGGGGGGPIETVAEDLAADQVTASDSAWHDVPGLDALSPGAGTWLAIIDIEHSHNAAYGPVFRLYDGTIDYGQSGELDNPVTSGASNHSSFHTEPFVLDGSETLAVQVFSDTAFTIRKYPIRGSDTSKVATHITFIRLDSGAGASDWVSGSEGSGQIIVPGSAGWPDRLPASPGADDDEFDALTGWTTLGTLDTLNVTDFPSHLHMVRNSVDAAAIDGIYKAAPSAPFTVTAKLSDRLFYANYHFCGLMIGDGSPGKMMTFMPWYVSGVPSTNPSVWTNRTTRSANSDIANTYEYGHSCYLRMVVHSTTNVDVHISRDGFVWQEVANGYNPALGSIAVVGLVQGGWTAALKMESVFDWIRFS